MNRDVALASVLQLQNLGLSLCFAFGFNYYAGMRNKTLSFNAAATPGYVLHSVGCLSACLYAALALNSHYHWITQNLWPLLVVWFGGGALLLGLCWFNAHNAMQPSYRQILVWALVLQVLGLLTLPHLENDYYRYLWDGYQFASQGNPYATKPSDFFGSTTVPLAMQPILDLVPYPQFSTIYGPVAQFIFLLAYLCLPGSIVPLKIFCLAASVASLCLLKNKLTPNKLLLLSWCSLFIMEGVVHLHCDIFLFFFMALALWAHLQQRFTLMVLALALAVGIKFSVVVVVPLFLWHQRAWFYLLFMAILGGLLLPFVVIEPHYFIQSYWAFASVWEFHSLLFGLFQLCFGVHAAYYMVLLAGLIIVGASYWHRAKTNPAAVPRGDLLLAGLLLFSPVINPWYMLWLLPFAAFYPTKFVWGFALLSGLSYLNGAFWPQANLALYQHPAWLRPLELIVLAGLLLWDAQTLRRLGPSYTDTH